MLPKVLSLLPRKRFENAGVSLPSELEFRFEDALDEEKIIEACRGMDFLFLPAAYPPITRRVLENISSVKMIQSAGTGRTCRSPGFGGSTGKQSFRRSRYRHHIPGTSAA